MVFSFTLSITSFAAGWNSADYYVARYLWWYLDDDIHSAESFKKFAQFNKDKSSFPWSSERLTATFRALKHLITLFIILMTAWLIAEKGWRRGLLLPQVPVDHDRNWDVETFLNHTCQKAMLPGDSWKDLDTKIYSFQAILFEEESPRGEITRKSLT